MFGFNKPKVRADAHKIDEFLTRGVENVFPNREYLAAQMKSGKRLKMYLGIDPTGPTLHLGHAITLKKLKEFQDLGHQVILLIGDFTGMIGDPTDKSATRKQLTRSEVMKNAALYKTQASTFLNFTGPNAARIEYNSKWLSKLSFEDVLNLSSKVTVDQMLKRDMFEKRMSEGKPIYIHEFMYPLMQGYDSVAMKVDGEIGGNDQTFNMLVGRDLTKQLSNREKFVLATKLLVDPTGKKMGKTEGNMVSLDQSAGDMFGKIMSWSDELIATAFELCTYVQAMEIDTLKASLAAGENPKNIKMRLADEIVTIYHGREAALKAKENFENTFARGGVPDEIVEVLVSKNEPVANALLAAGIVESKSEWRRLVGENAVTEIETSAKVTDPNVHFSKDLVLKVGKRRFVKIKIK